MSHAVLTLYVVEVDHLFPVIFSGFFRCILCSWHAVGFCVDRGRVTKCLIFKAQVVIKAMLKATSNSPFIIELSIRNPPLVALVQRTFREHVTSQRRIYLQIHKFRLYAVHLMSYISLVYTCTIPFRAHLHSGCVTWVPVKQACLVCIKNSFK